MFTMGGNPVIQPPVLVLYLSQHASNAVDSAMVSSSAVCASCTQRRWISQCTSHSSMTWYPVLNYVCLQRATAMCTVTTHEATELYQADRVGFGIAISS